MGWAALAMGVSVLLSRFMGLIRDKIIAYLFGATAVLGFAMAQR